MIRCGLLLLWLLAFLAGCTAMPRVTFVDGPADPATLHGLRQDYDRYVEQNGAPKRAIREVFLFRRARLPQPWGDYIGWCAWSEDEATIYLADTRAFRHELHHAAIGDPDHQHASWSTYARGR